MLIVIVTVFLLGVVQGNQLGLATELRNDSTVHSHTKMVVCYLGTWANYRPEGGKFTPDHVDATLCTHIIYSFVGLDTQSWTIKSLDPWMDLEDGGGLAGFRKVTSLKYTHPHIKVTLAIGGWNEGSERYSTMAKDEAKRRSFVMSAVKFLDQHNFDGLDLDWEYPGKRGGVAEDKQNFIKLIKDLHKEFSKRKLLLTAAIGAASDTIDKAYDVEMMYKYLDYVHIMCYDYHGKWDKKTGHNAPLHLRPTESAKDQTLNVEYTLDYLLKRGAKPEKTVLGVPMYGRAYKLTNPNLNEIGAPTKVDSFQGPYTREDGFMGYNEICVEKTTSLVEPWTEVWEEHYMAPYMYRGDSWLSYDNEKSIAIKSEFAFDACLAGVMVWSIDTDDFLGVCGGPKFPLLRSINHALHSRQKIYNHAPSLTNPFNALLLSLIPTLYVHIRL